MQKQNFIAGTEFFNTVDEHVNAPIFKRVFYYNGESSNLILTIFTVGFYKIFLNGAEFTKGSFAPYISNPDDLIYGDEYSINNLIKEGENVLYIILGNGFSNANDFDIWNFATASYRRSPCFSLQIKDDDKILLTTDEKFEVCDSPILFDDLRCGEWYNATLENCSDFEFSLYTKRNLRSPILVNAPKGKLKICEAQPIKEIQRLKPVDIIKTQKGYVYDFGKNLSGVCELNITAPLGQEIDLTYFEIMQEGEPYIGNISFGERSRKEYVQHDKYYCRQGSQTWTPSFTYHGFRYVYVEGLNDEQKNDFLTCIEMHSDIKSRAKFQCSNEIINKIQQCTIQSDLSNFFYFPTDCPHREKNGWTGDVNLSAEQILYNFHCENSFDEWIQNVCAAQKEDGALPGIVPTSGWGFEWGNGPAWDGVLFETTYQLYRFTDNLDYINKSIQNMLKYIDYLYKKMDNDGLIGFGLGDWCEVGTLMEYQYNTPVQVTDTLVCIDFLRKAQTMFKAVNYFEDCEKAKKLEQILTNNFKKVYIDSNKVKCQTQTAQAMAIGLGLFDSEEKQAYEELKKLIERDGEIFKVGVIGVKWIFNVLAEHGDIDLAIKLITNTDKLGYGYIISKGATTLWESFNELDEKAFPEKYVRKDGGNLPSFNHHFWGSISAWFYKYLAGINVISRNFLEINPYFPKAIDYVESEFENDGKSIKLKWRRLKNKIEVEIENFGFEGVLNIKNKIKLKEEKEKFVIQLNK